MAKPVADDFKALIPDPSASMCGNFINTLLKLPVLIWRYISALEGTGGGTLSSTLKTGDYVSSAAPSAQDATRLLCDGAEYAKTAYPNLYLAIGDIYGPATNGANFKVPNCGGKFLVGVGTFTNRGAAVLGTPGGADQQIVTEAQLPKYTPGHLKTTNGTDTVLTYANGTGATKNGPGIGGFAVQNAPVLELEDTSYGADTPAGVPTLPPFMPVYVYIIT